MKKNLLLIFLVPLFSLSQTQIGGDIDGEAANDESGYSVSLSSNGSIVAIGTPKNDDNGDNSGYVKVYENISAGWVQLGGKIEGLTSRDLSGFSVSLSGDGSTLAIGAPYNNISIDKASGLIRVYKYSRSSDVWIKIGHIKGEKWYELAGYSVSLSFDGSIMAIGAPNANATSFGYVRIYEYYKPFNRWRKKGSDIEGKNGAGRSVSLSDDGATVAIGTSRFYKQVSVYKYSQSLNNWMQIGASINEEEFGGAFGSCVSLSGNGSVVAIGDFLNDGNGNLSGNVKIYKNESGNWKQLGSDIDGETEYDESGYSVSLSNDGTIVAIGGPRKNSYSGRVRIFKYSTSLKDWIKSGSSIDGENTSDSSGASVSLSSDGSIVAIGAPKNLNTSRSGHVRVYKLNTLLSSNSFVPSQFKMAPNPSGDQTTIKLNKDLTLEKINIYNNLGQFIQSTNKETIDTSGLSTGLYYLEVLTNKGKTTKKLVIE